jgi:hypothetical protein
MLGPKSQSDAVVARVRMFIAGTKSPAESAERARAARAARAVTLLFSRPS